jgi:UDP-N-acetyl-D-mannosaminuronic acid dehydrogenase
MTAANQRTIPLYGADVPDPEIAERFRSGEWPVAVYGLGKMGLPVAAVFAEVTGGVTGVDLDGDVVSRVNAGESPVLGEPGLESLICDLVETGRLGATTDGRAAAEAARIHLLLVPTSLQGRRPDLSSLRTAARSVGQGIDPGDVVLVESTVPPFACRRDVKPVIAEESGLSSDEFGVACCPERSASGRALQDIRESYPRVVGGVTDESTRIAQVLYNEITANRVIPVADAATAACVKLFEGVYRDVNIALANELATFTDELGIDVRSAIRAANTQPYCAIHDPGPGVGGHCIPYYPWFLIAERSQPSRLIRTARRVNELMPAYTAELVFRRLENRGVRPSESTVLILGIAYRPGVAEASMSPARGLATTLSRQGVVVYAVDPIIDSFPPMDAERVALEDIGEVDPDMIVLVTPHEEFETIDWDWFDGPSVVDCHATLDPDAIPHPVYALGSG